MQLEWNQPRCPYPLGHVQFNECDSQCNEKCMRHSVRKPMLRCISVTDNKYSSWLSFKLLSSSSNLQGSWGVSNNTYIQTYVNTYMRNTIMQMRVDNAPRLVASLNSSVTVYVCLRMYTFLHEFNIMYCMCKFVLVRCVCLCGHAQCHVLAYLLYSFPAYVWVWCAFVLLMTAFLCTCTGYALSNSFKRNHCHFGYSSTCAHFNSFSWGQQLWMCTRHEPQWCII